MLIPRLTPYQVLAATTLGYGAKFKALRGAVRDPTRVALAIYLGRPPWRIRFRDGSIVVASAPREIFELIHRKTNPVPESALTSYLIPTVGRVVKFRTLRDADGMEVLQKEIYANLPVKNRTVVDVGANVGDSPLYFSIKGARRVLAYEPDPEFYKTAVENLSLNGVKNVSIISTRVTGNRDSIEADQRSRLRDVSSPCSRSTAFPDSSAITLDQVLEAIEDTDVSLKVDCEGCEYELILGTAPELLAKVGHIQLEYHYGPRLLVNRLRSLGYDVTVSKPSYTKLLRNGDLMVSGDIWASRSNAPATQ